MKRNYIQYILSVAVILLALSACSKLDREQITTLSEKQVTESYDYTRNRLAAIYADLPNGFLAVDGAMMASATDDAEHTFDGSAVQKFNVGAWSAYDNPNDVWGKYFTAIRKVNLFLETADSVKMDYYKLDPNPSSQAVYKTRIEEINRWKYEVRFLRAYFYFELIKRYGGVPIITRTYAITDDFQDTKRNPLSECINFITAECDSTANILPVRYGDGDLGHATKGAALALKSKTLLYAASELFSNASWAGGYAHPELITVTEDRNVKWKAAAGAAKAVIDLGTYSLSGNYNDLFTPSSYTNNELILVRRNGNSNDFEKASYSVGFDMGQSGTTPSQNLIDAYEMKDGTAFNWNDPTMAADPYSNRDPRLAMTVITNNSFFKNRTIECWIGGLDGEDKERATKTGYYLRKYVDPQIDLLQNQSSVHSWSIMRLADIFLSYAEALNEYDPGNADIKKYVDMVRMRAGMPALDGGLSQNAMRDKIRNERRVELAFEDQRSWDVRRWMTAQQYFNEPLEGVSVNKTGANIFTYKKMIVENRKFDAKMYLYPIPQSELFIAKDWAQNPMW